MAEDERDFLFPHEALPNRKRKGTVRSPDIYIGKAPRKGKDKIGKYKATEEDILRKMSFRKQT